MDGSCPLCGLVKKKNLYNHLFFAHSYTKQQIEDFKEKRRREKIASSCATLLNCKLCERIFTSKDCLRKHIKKVHPEKNLEEERAKIWCPLCYKRLKHHRDLVQHAQEVHAEAPGQFSVEIINFSNLKEFEKWRRLSEEHDATSRSVASSKSRNGRKVKYLRCHRAALSNKEKMRIDNPMIRHSIKAVPFCTAYMKVIEGDFGVQVEYCPTHCGHTVEPQLLKLDEQSEQYIVSLLKKGYKCRKVYDIIQENTSSQTQLHLVSLRKIWSIAKKYSLRPTDTRNKGASESEWEEEGGFVEVVELDPKQPQEILFTAEPKCLQLKTTEPPESESLDLVLRRDLQIHPIDERLGQAPKLPEPRNDRLSRTAPLHFVQHFEETRRNSQSLKSQVDYEMANMEVVSRIEKIIAGFHADVLQVAMQANQSSYSILNRALRAMEATRAVTLPVASKVFNESGH